MSLSTDAKQINENNLSAAWGADLQPVVCERCDWSYLVPAGGQPERCPRCFQAALTPLDDGSQASAGPPERMLPFTLSAAELQSAVQSFARGIPYAPRDLSPANLQARLRRVYLPMWLVDAHVQAAWKAEAGFDYQVVSHQDQYDQNRGGWSSREVQEGRVRWEPRLGRLSRSYTNLPAPALEEHARIQRLIGGFDSTRSEPYQPKALEGASVRLPDRLPTDAWSDARQAFQSAAADECRQAIAADHLRQFAWQPEFSNQNWTQLLLPLYTAYYLDDEGTPQPAFIHGQSGRISGVRRASPRRARQASLIVLGIAVLIFLLSLLVTAGSLLLPILLAAGVFGLALALLVGAGAIIPVATAWWFNRSQTAA